ncbi:uncharacterized protein [Fopius arisanus]|uniref:Uncharacterized protein isoform X2 n=1 Tax=Fopius arisanus TaxID=64838 RepID=A0A9R1TW57_9HYME|nr:PREDICTED: uncharacterized protein LOC105263560 isoform X2 [Fopius arisanus]
MEVLLLLTIFLDVHLVFGWNQNISKSGGAVKSPVVSPLSPVKHFFSLTRPKLKSPQASSHENPSVHSHYRVHDNNEYADDPWLDYNLENDPWGFHPQPQPQNCLVPALAASGTTALIILSIIVFIFKFIPSLFVANSRLTSLQMLAKAAESWFTGTTQAPNVMHGYNRWTPERMHGGDWMGGELSGNYGVKSPFLKNPKDRHSPFKKPQNINDLKKPIK